MSSALERFAARCSSDLWFLGHLLREYARCNHLDDAALANRLGCSLNALTRVRLCRTLRTDPAGCAEGIRDIAAGVGCDARALARVFLASELKEQQFPATPKSLEI